MEVDLNDETAKNNFLINIKNIINETAYEGVKVLLDFSNSTEESDELKAKTAIDLYNNVCLPNLNKTTNDKQPALYHCIEEVLKIATKFAAIEDVMIDVMDRIEECKEQCVFVSLLRVMQIILQRQGEKKPRATEWCLHSISTHLKELKLAKELSEGYDAKQARLLEQDPLVEQLIAKYIFIGFFYEPLIEEISLNEMRKTGEIFIDCGVTRRNVFCCFFVRLLGRPLALLDLSYDETNQSNAYALQCAKNLTNAINKCFADPYFLLSFVERRARWERRIDASKDVYEMSSHNIFLIEEKMPLYALGIYYHSLFIYKLVPENAPKVYTPLYIFESCLYLAAALLAEDEPSLQSSGVRLTQQQLNILTSPIPCSSLDLKIYQTFCTQLSGIVSYSPILDLRKKGLAVIETLIKTFDDEGRYLVILNLLQNLTHNGLKGYIASLYKDYACKAIMSGGELSDTYKGKKFRSVLMMCIDVLPRGAQTDLLEHGDPIFSAINIVRFFLLGDKQNLTGFWDLLPTIQEKFLEPLRIGLDYSLAHYKFEHEKTLRGDDSKDNQKIQKTLDILDVKVSNKKKSKIEISRKEKIDVIEKSLVQLQSMRALVGYAYTTIEAAQKEYKQQAKENVN